MRTIQVWFVLLVDLKVLVLLECRVESKHDVQGLHNWIVYSRVHRDVQNIASHSTVICQGQVDLLTWSLHVAKKFFHLWWPYLHERINVWHAFRVANWRRLLVFLNICNWVDPLQDLFRILLCAFNRMHLRILAPSVNFTSVDQIQVYLSLIRLIEAGFILN